MTTDLVFLIIGCAAWLNRTQDRRLHFLVVQNRILRDVGGDPLRMTEVHRRTLGEAAHGLTPTEDWMVQQARNLTDPDYGFLRGRRFLLMDRDPTFSARFRRTLTADVEPIRTPPQSPNCNPFIERFIRSLKEECLCQCIPYGQAGLRHLVNEYIEHYHRERPHAGLDDALIKADPLVNNRSVSIDCRRRLGGLLTFYHRVAA